jgi:hypothetical protein
MQGPSAKGEKEMLKTSRNRLRWLAGLLTGQCHLNEHLFELMFTNSPIYERCLEKINQPHVSSVIVRRSLFKISSPGPVFYDAPISKVLLFVRSVRLIKG